MLIASQLRLYTRQATRGPLREGESTRDGMADDMVDRFFGSWGSGGLSLLLDELVRFGVGLLSHQLAYQPLNN